MSEKLSRAYEKKYEKMVADKVKEKNKGHRDRLVAAGKVFKCNHPELFADGFNGDIKGESDNADIRDSGGG